MVKKVYSVLTAMDSRELIEKVNWEIMNHNASLVGGVSARGAQFLQAITFDLEVPDPELEMREVENQEQDSKQEQNEAPSPKPKPKQTAPKTPNIRRLAPATSTAKTKKGTKK